MSDLDVVGMGPSSEAEEYRAFMKELNNLGVEMLGSLNRIDHIVRNISSELRAAHKEVSDTRAGSAVAEEEDGASA
ncbi:MAG: hypothetical protein M3Y56_04865 [Armatimonadota bacterium]|nr:hypothetical protein [Armatimonadota bacterium]